MLALQKCLADQVEIVPLMEDLEFEDTPDGLVCLNPPVFTMPAKEPEIIT